MTVTTENILLIGGILLFISVIAGKTSSRFGIPTLLLFLSIGMLAGSDGFGGVHFDDAKLAQFIGVVSLNFILFSGGLDTSWKSVKPVLWVGFSLSTLGVFLTASLLGIFVWSITEFSIYEALLLGAIVSSTDAAAVFSILRSKSVALKYNLRPTLELESGSNDPMAYVLTIVFLKLVLDPGLSFLSAISTLFQQMIVGALIGIALAKVSKYLINTIKLEFESLYPVLVISFIFLTFTISEFFGGNGFLAVYLSAVYLGNQDLIHKKAIVKMFDGWAWLMQIILFLTLGLLVFPSQVLPYSLLGIMIALFLMLVARPVSVFVSLLFSNYHFRSKLFISWVGLRGAVPIVFATYPMLAGIDKASMIFNTVFFVSVTSVLLQGTTLSMLAKWLRVSLPEKVKKRELSEIFLSEHPKTILKEILIEDGNPIIGKKIVELGFPKTAIIAMIQRAGVYITPGGSTILESGDLLIVLADTKAGLEAACASLCLRNELVEEVLT